MADAPVRHEFQAETRQLLSLMVHSIYSDKDVFLRELVSNASDALDKLKLAAFRDKDLDVDTSDLHVRVEADPEARTLTVRDNGIGMSGDEVVDLIGTIARSGTAELLRKLREAGDSGERRDLIGQFGVGFYSTFIVADTVTLLTRKAGDDTGVRWESTGDGTYTVEAVDGLPVGTAVTLALKPVDEEDGLHDYTDPAKIRAIVKRYSDFLAWPIRMRAAEDVDETLNSMKALWARPADQVSADDYNELYKHIAHDWTDPLTTIHTKAEGTFEYEALLFVPGRAPFDLFHRDSAYGLQLYVKRVMIMESCPDLLPPYLRFVKGVVDAQDLSLNISREILQRDRHIQLMRRRLTKKVLQAVKDLMVADDGRYTTFWQVFGKAVKEGLLGFDDRDAILEICSFASTADADKPTTLTDYVSRMGSEQKEIYYATGDSRATVEASPHLEAFKAKGIEVLLLTDPVDEMWVDAVGTFEGKQFRSVAKGEVDLDPKPEAEKPAGFEGLLTWLAATLDDVKDVRLSSRLTTSPACLVGDAFDLTPAMERTYRAMGQEVPAAKRILELNPDHPLVTGLRAAHETDPANEDLVETAEILYGTALLAEGGELKDPARFARLVADRLTRTV